jgi:hypothetical protein
VIVAPPLLTGAVQVTTEEALALDVADTPVGAPGTVAGVTVAEGRDAALLPAALVAVTVKVYGEPLVRPDTVQLVDPVVVQTKLPGDDVTVYPVTVAPPVALAVQLTSDEPLALDVPDTPVGAPGTVAGVTELEAAEALLVPIPLAADTVNVYAVPAVRPEVMVQVVAVATATVQLPPAGLDVAVYPVMVDPPLAGSVQLTTTWGAEPKAMPGV